MVILDNIDIDIDIDKAILQNIDIDKISNRFKFGISDRATWYLRYCSLKSRFCSIFLGLRGNFVTISNVGVPLSHPLGAYVGLIHCCGYNIPL